VIGPRTTLNDRYTLTSRVGGGGMGEVWRADDTVLGRVVAVKVMTPALAENPTFAQRFLNEARAMATLRHPGVVDVYDYGTCDVGGRRMSFLVMEYVEGESLDRVLRREPLGPAAAMRLVADVADALSAAHGQGIVHRDVKPANLLIRADGRVALTDFGIAHSVSAGQLTATGTMLCSAGYCAPELATASEVTPAADLYALGVVAYECLTGHLPFQGETPVQIIYRHLHAPVPELPGGVPPGPREVVMRALEKAPEHRWASAAAMARAARDALAEPGSTPAAEPPPFPGSGPGHVPSLAGTVPGPAPHAAPGPAAGSAGSGAGSTGSASWQETGSLPADLTAPRGARRRRLTGAVLSVAAAVAVTAGVAGSIWTRPGGTADPLPVSPPAATTTASATTAAPPADDPPGGDTQSAPPARNGTAPPRRSATPTPSATGEPSQTPSATPSGEPSQTPSATPTDEPEPTDEPTAPDPQEPTAEPTVTAEPGDIQCVRSPCP
jgi:serine/threonine-protein kinase